MSRAIHRSTGEPVITFLTDSVATIHADIPDGADFQELLDELSHNHRTREIYRNLFKPKMTGI